MIVSYSTIEDVGVGFCSRLFRPIWMPIKEKLAGFEEPHVPPIDVRYIIGSVSAGREISKLGDGSLLSVIRVPASEFGKLTIAEKNEFVLREIGTSVEQVLALLELQPSTELQEALSKMQYGNNFCPEAGSQNGPRAEI